MNRTRSFVLCLVVFLAAFAILALPGTVAAAPAHSSVLSRANNSVIVDAPVQPSFSIPGIFSLVFGNNGGATQLDVPGLNATATVDGLTIGPSLGWKAITLNQKEPAVTSAGTISGAQVSVGGPDTGYSGTASAQFDLHPGPGFQAAGTVAVNYDGLNKRTGVMLQDASVTVPTWPVGLAMTGVNTGQGTLTIDTAQVGIPAAGTAVTVNGFHAGSGGTGWDSLSVAQGPNAPLKLGKAATISGIELDVPGAASNQPTTLSAHFDVSVGPVAAAGEFIGVKSASGGPSGVALKDASATVQIPGWGLQFTGINSVQGGAQIDKIAFAAEPINLAAELTGVTVGAGGGFAFDEAQITYLPQGGDGQIVAGAFQMTMTKSDAGYILTTQSLLPIAARK
jgi:hypothetical protein